MSDKQPLQRKQLILIVIVSVVLVTAVLSLLTANNVDRDRETLRMHEECGAMMAELTKQAMGKGKSVFVLEHDGRGLPPDKQEWMRIQTEGFYAALGSGVEVTKAGVGEDAPNALRARADGSAANPTRWRRDAYAPMATKAPEVDAIVSFIGEPIVGPQGAKQWEHLPPLVCFSLGGDHIAPLMEAGIVVSAIVPRRGGVSIKAARNKSWFQVMYEVLTPDGLAEWVGNGEDFE